MSAMARAATTTDAFNAVAEPRRRQILDVLTGERPVSELVEALGLAQPQVFEASAGASGGGGGRGAGRGEAAAVPAERGALKPIR